MLISTGSRSVQRRAYTLINIPSAVDRLEGDTTDSKCPSKSTEIVSMYKKKKKTSQSKKQEISFVLGGKENSWIHRELLNPQEPVSLHSQLRGVVLRM